MKKLLAITLALLLLLGLAACGGSASKETMAATEAAAVADGDYGWVEEPMEAAPESEEAGSGTDGDGTFASGLKIIKTGDMTIESENFDETDQYIRKTVESYGGILAERSISGSLGYRWAGYTVRIPSAHFDEFFYEITGSCTVLNQTVSSEDVTERYSDLETQLKTAEKKYERLLVLMDKAETLTDLYSIEAEIANVEYEIDSLKGTLNGLDSRIAYSTIYINLEETTKVTAVPEELSFGASFAAALKNGTNNVVDGFLDFLLYFAYNWFSLLLTFGFIAVILIVAVRVWKKKTKKETPPVAPPEKPSDKSDK